MADDSLVTLWRATFQKYRSSTDNEYDIQYDKALQGLNSFDDLSRNIESTDKDFQNFRRKNVKLWSTLSKLCQPVMALSGITSNVVALSPYAPASLIFGAAMHLIEAGQKVSGAYDEISGVFTNISLALERFDEYRAKDLDPKLKNRIAEIFCKTIEIMGHTQSLVRRGRARAYIDHIFSKNDKMTGLKSDLTELVDAEGRLVGALVYSGVKRVESKVDRMAKANQGMGEAVGDLRKRSRAKEEQEKMDRIFRQSTFLKVQIRHRQLQEECIEQTGMWLQQNKVFNNWSAGHSTILSLLGEGGVGKSHLAVRMIESLQQRYSTVAGEEQSVAVAYYYISKSDQELTNTNNLLRCVAWQLLGMDPDFARLVSINASELETVRYRDTWNSIFKPYFESDRWKTSLAIVVDAVDEMNSAEREAFFEVVRNIDKLSRENQPSRIRLVLTGRPDLLERVREFGPILEISRLKMREDVRLYVNENIKNINVVKAVRDRRKKIGLMKALRDKVLEGDFVFLWIELILGELKDVDRLSEVKAILNRPVGIFELIEAVVERIEAENLRPRAYEDLNTILAWILHGRRDISLGELDLVLKLKEPIGEGIPIDRLEELLRGKFGAFFVVSREDGETTESLQEKILTAKHSRAPASNLEQEQQAGADLIELDELDLDADDVEAFDLEQVVENEEGLSKHSIPGINHIEKQLAVTASASSRPSEEENPWLSDPSSTTVLLRHNLIRDYFVETGRSKGGIGFDYATGHYDLLETCLKLLVDGVPTVLHAPPLLDYAAEYFLWHLRKVDYGNLDDQEMGNLVSLLTDVFSSLAAQQRWMRNHPWLDDLLTDLFVDDLATDAWEWIRGSIDESFVDPRLLGIRDHLRQNRRNLFAPLARTVASEWLEVKDLEMDSQEAVSFLSHYSCLYLDSDSDLVRDAKFCSQLSPEDIRDLAKMWYDEENRDSRWHERVGLVMQKAGHHASALEEFRKAIEKDGTNLDAVRLAKDCLADLGNMETSAAICKYVLSAWPVRGWTASDRNEWRSSLAKFSHTVFDFAQAIESSEEVFTQEPNGENFQALVEHMSGAGHLKAVAHLMVQLWCEKNEDGERKLPVLLSQADVVLQLRLMQVSIACVYHDRPLSALALHKDENLPKDWHELMDHVYADLIALKKREDASADCIVEEVIRSLIETTFLPGKDAISFFQPKIERLWPRAIQKNTDLGLFMFGICFVVLADLYLVQGLEAVRKRFGAGVEVTLRELQRLLNLYQAQMTPRFAKRLANLNGLWSPNPFSQAIGVLQLFRGKITESKEQFREPMKVALHMLSDDTAKNDTSGFWMLGGLLLNAGDVENAITAYSVSGISFEKAKKRFEDGLARLEQRQAEEKERSAPPQLKDLLKLSISPADPTQKYAEEMTGGNMHFQQRFSTELHPRQREYPFIVGLPHKSPASDSPSFGEDVNDEEEPSSLQIKRSLGNELQVTLGEDVTSDANDHMPVRVSAKRKQDSGSDRSTINNQSEDVEPQSKQILKPLYSPTPSDEYTVSDASDTSSNEILAPLGDESPHYECSLSCIRRSETYTTIYRCRYCMAPSYCGECYKTYRPNGEIEKYLRAGNTSVEEHFKAILFEKREIKEMTAGEKALMLSGIMDCLSWHPLVRVHPPEGGVEARAYLAVQEDLDAQGNKVLGPRSEWIDALREQWQIFDEEAEDA